MVASLVQLLNNHIYVILFMHSLEDSGLNIHLIVCSNKKGQSLKIIPLKDLPWEVFFFFFFLIANKADFSSLLALNYTSTIRLTTEHIEWDYYYWLQLIMIQPLGLCRTLFSLRSRYLCLSGVKWSSTCPVTKWGQVQIEWVPSIQDFCSNSMLVSPICKWAQWSYF